MKTLSFLILLIGSSALFAQEDETLVIEYFQFLFLEDIAKGKDASVKLGEPEVGRFSSISGHQMIVVSAPTEPGNGYYVLMSENELGMGYLAWKARGFDLEPQEAQAFYMKFDQTDFDYYGW